MRLLALDLATQVGWALGDIGAEPIWGCVHLTRKGGPDYGPTFSQFHDWLQDQIIAWKVDAVVMETPILAKGGGIAAKYIAATLAGLTEMACHNLGADCSQVHGGTLKKHFTGHGRADKDAMIAAAYRRGWKVTEHDEADALAAWHYAVWCRDPQAAFAYDMRGKNGAN